MIDLDEDEREVVLIAIDFFIKKDEEEAMYNNWTINVLKDARKKISK